MRTLIFVAACIALVMAIAGAPGVKAWLIYNPSHSVKPGLYLRDDSPLQRGVFVTVRATDVARGYAHLRHFDGAHDHFIKRIAGAPGDLVCATGNAIYLNHLEIAHRLERDSLGRLLPRWSGCERLGADRYFLLGDTPDSFDGRYWGPVSLSIIDGAWRHIASPASRSHPPSWAWTDSSLW